MVLEGGELSLYFAVMTEAMTATMNEMMARRTKVMGCPLRMWVLASTMVTE